MEYNTSILSLGYILSPDKKNILMLYHSYNSGDISYGKYNGYSDFLQPNESALECFERIVYDMTRLTVEKSRFRGAIHWPNFKQKQRSFFSQVFICDEFTGTPSDSNSLGENRWVGVDEVLNGNIPIWEGDKHFLPLVLDSDARAFHGYMPYENGIPREWSAKRA